METRIYPYKDADDEELGEKVFRRAPINKHIDSIDIRDSQKEVLQFLETKTEEDSFEVSDDITEDQLDQALFEASYSKPPYESDEYRGK